MNTLGLEAGIIAVPVMAAIGVGAGWFLIERRRERRFFEMLHAWGRAEGYRIEGGRRVVRAQIPEELSRDPRASTGVYVVKFRAVSADGRTRRGFIRFPLNEGRFAAPVLVTWERGGPSFDDLS